MIVPSWLTLLSWSLVSRTVQCTQCFWQRLGRKVVGGGGSSKNILVQLESIIQMYPNVASLRTITCNHCRCVVIAIATCFLTEDYATVYYPPHVYAKHG